jgi:hypothetical protein
MSLSTLRVYLRALEGEGILHLAADGSVRLAKELLEEETPPSLTLASFTGPTTEASDSDADDDTDAEPATPVSLPA